MPYKVRKLPKQEKYGIYNTETGKRVAVSETREKAKAYARIRQQHHKT